MPNIEIGVDFMVKENFIYVGIDLHKETHTAVMIDCYNQKLGEITFPNRPADFPKLVTKVKKCNTDAKEVVYGLENAYGYGRPLAVWLIDKGYFVKDVNTAISHRQAKHRSAMYRKSDSDDAEAIALATLNMLDKLPDACPNDAYWSLGQLVHRRDNIMKQRTRLVNQLHEQLCIAYPSYKSFLMTSVDLLHCTSGSIIHPESILGVSLWKICVRNLFPSATIDVRPKTVRKSWMR